MDATARGARRYFKRYTTVVSVSARIRRRISVYLPRVASRLPAVRRHPLSDRVVRLVHAVVRAAVDRDGSLARRRFGRVHLAASFKCARDLDTEVAQYRRARLGRAVVEEILWPSARRPGGLRMKSQILRAQAPMPSQPGSARPPATPAANLRR